VDAHVHLYEDPTMADEETILVAVSDDLESSLKTLSLKGENVVPCVGVHPWSSPEVGEEELKEFEKLVERALCLGEIGLDKRYVPDFEKQRRVFEHFLTLSKEYSLPVNLHALDAWEEVFNMLLRYDVDRAYFHWFNGPLHLLDEIVSQGYYVGINAAAKIQKKHLRVIERAPLTSIMTESDGPYVYRGVKLTPKAVPELIGIIAKVKKVSEEAVAEAVLRNFKRWSGALAQG